jgi:HEAT repeat protein
MPLTKEEGVGILVDALGDDNKRVRYAAASMLKSAGGVGIDDELAAVIAGNKVPEAVMLSVIDALAGRDTPRARATLESIAGRRLSVNRSSRAIRNAAKAALEGAHE